MVRPTYTGPARPIGYIEAQSAWVGYKPMSELIVIVDELRQKTLSQNPGMIPHGGRIEEVLDGAGVAHYHLYLGFVPRHAPSEPLDPHNMNDAPLSQPGQMQPDDVTLPMGYKETNFGRGT